MSKFKAGDKVKAIESTPLLIKHQVYEVLRLDSYGTVIVRNSLIEATYDDRFFELVSPPFQLEVGKPYCHYRHDGHVLASNVYVVYVDAHGALLQFNDGSRGWWKAERLHNFKAPPPPEEWRALYYRPNSRPEVSAAYWDSESKCKEYHDDDDLPLGERNFMYAIRTDIYAKENK